ncbi:hypothetical protein Tco_0825057, partial [Tanacetum coccineum]
TLVDDGFKCSPRLRWRIYKLLSRKFWTYMKHISKSFHVKGISLLVHLESDVMLLIGNCSPEFLHVDGRDTCCDQEGWIKRSERENIQSNLKGGFLGLECGAQSVVSIANHKTLFPWNKSIVQCLLLLFCNTHDSAKKESI